MSAPRRIAGRTDPRRRGIVVAFALAVALGQAPLSAAPSAPASVDPPRPAAATPGPAGAQPAPGSAPATPPSAPAPADNERAPGAAGEASRDARDAGVPADLPVVRLAPPVDAPAIALVLPLQSPTFGRAAEAVKAGFTAAADVAGVKALVVGHDDAGFADAYAKARDAGARVLVGPLVRDDLKTLASAPGEPPPTIALNQYEDGGALPANVYTLTLALDGEARQLARAIIGGGAHTVGIIGSDGALPRRLASAFAAAWLLQGGDAPVQLRVDRTPETLALLKRELARTPLDAIFLAVGAADAGLVKPYLGQLPVYASSQVNDRQPRETLRDLDDVRFVEIPWLADPAAAAFARLPRPELPNASLDRLYALGIDAFRAAQLIAERGPDALEFDGATGHLTLDPSRQFVREARLMRFEAGQVVPVTGP